MKKRCLVALSLFFALVLSFALAACGGGDGKIRLRFETNGGPAIEAIAAEAGEDIREKLPADPVRIGYVFGGWYLESDCSGTRQGLPTVMPEKDVTYYAKWTAAAPAMLTLASNDGGTLSKTSFEVPVGTLLSDVLKDCTPTDIKTGLTFAGWFRGSEQIEDGATMPASPLTLTAKYTANYTVKVYTQAIDGSYAASDGPSGSAFYGEQFNAAALVQTPEHFFLDLDAEGYFGETDALPAAAEFAVYLSREVYSVIYIANAPDGAEASGSTQREEVLYGSSVGAAENGYTMSGAYRFAGWATTERGDVEYLPGDQLSPTTDIRLYARWEVGLRDLFGGADTLYVSITEENVVHLRRDVIGEKEGTYDPATGVFSFKDGENVVLDGRVTERWFFYFTDAYEATYKDLEGSDSTLTLSPHGQAVYTFEGKNYAGTYGIDLDTLYFSFNSPELSFLFSLFEQLNGGDVVFRRQDTEEEGYYYDADAKIVLYLDGLGGLEYHYNNQNYEYQILGSPILTANGYYEWSEESGLYLAYTRDAVSILKEFTFSLGEKGPAPSEYYENIGEIKGSAHMDDGLRGDYTDKWGTTDKALMLDGYGQGTFGGEDGTYTLITWLYVYEEEDSDVVDDYLLVRFLPKSGGVVYFRLDMQNGEFELDRSIAESDFAEGIPYGRYDFESVYVLNMFSTGFLYIFENGDAEFWSVYAEMNSGDLAYVLYTELMSTVTKNADGTYHFNQSGDGIGNLYENAFDFTVDEAARTGTAVYPEPHDVLHILDGLTVDLTEGIATYNGTRIAYGFTLGYIDLYIFLTGETETRYFITSDDKTFTEVFLSDMYNIAYPGGAEENEYSGQLLYAGEHVYLGFLLEGGLYRYIGEGTVTKTADAEHFSLNSGYLNDFTASDLADYSDFDYKRTEGQDGGTGVFYQKNTDIGYTNFTTDGYGTFTFTDGGKQVTGRIVSQVGTLFFFASDGGDSYMLTADGNTVYDVTQTDAGFWYEMNDNRLISQYEYLVLNGRGVAVFYAYNPLDGTLSETHATYQRTANWSEGFLEYAISGQGVAGNYLLGVYEISNGTERDVMPLYQKQIPHRIGEFEVIGGGHVSSVGYPNEVALYTDAEGNTYEGNMYLGRVNTGTSSHEFINANADASNYSAVRFWVYENFIATNTEFIFDVTGGQLSLRTLAYGDYALGSRDGVDTQTVLSLDGHGSAQIKKGYTSLGSGTYSALADGRYLFEGTLDGERGSFVFRTSSVTDEDDFTTYIYEQYSAALDNVYISDADWAVLQQDGFGGATLIGRYGTVLSGSYTRITDTLGYFAATGYETLVTLTGEKFAFVDNSDHVATYYAEDLSAIEFGLAKLIAGGKEYFYTVANGTVTRYAADGTQDTIPLPDGDTYTLDGTQYRLLSEEVTFTDTEYAGVTLTLSFLPDGAIFTAPADFSKGDVAGMGYSVSVSYEDGKVSVTLHYQSDAKDSLPEEYALTLHFTGSENTFSVQPLGEQATFTDSADTSNKLIIDGLRVGQFLVTDSLKAEFNGIPDSSDAPISYKGLYSEVQTDIMQYDYHFGYGKVITIKAADGRNYTLRFFLDTAQNTFILISLTVDRTFEIEQVGPVTVVQLWKAGRDYAGAEQLSVVAVTVPASGVTETIFNSTVEDGKKALLVRGNYNTTTGAWAYETYVIELTYDEDRIVTEAVCDGAEYRYGEATQGVVHKIAFVYTVENGEFKVQYLLSYSYRDNSVSATFQENGDGSWTVQAETDGGGTETFTVKITRGSNGFTLTVTGKE